VGAVAISAPGNDTYQAADLILIKLFLKEYKKQGRGKLL
jgi:hypothetical protein